MRYGVCHLSSIAVRSEPSESAEMSSQLLYGERFKILEHRIHWSRIQFFSDSYEGWISNLVYKEVPEDIFQEISTNQPPIYC